MITATEAHGISDNYLSPKMANFIESMRIEHFIQRAACNGEYGIFIQSPSFISEDGLTTWEREEWPTYKEVKKYFGHFGYRVERTIRDMSVPNTSFVHKPLYRIVYTFRW